MADPKSVVRFTQRSGKRVAVATVGVVVLLAGIVMLAIPGPGLATVFAGLAILATEFPWARRLLEYTRRRFREAYEATRNRAKGRGNHDDRDEGRGNIAA